MMAASIPDRVVKMLPRLASDHDGEVVATVAAIRRTLEGAGLNLHDLAAAITAPPVRWEQPKAKPQPQEKPFRSFADLAPGDARRLANTISTQFRNKLNTWEQEFLGSIAGQLLRRPDKLLSTAQVSKLNAIWRKTVGAV